jgi:spore protease
MLERRTDLAMEAKELWEESATRQSKLEGVKATESLREGFRIDSVHILNEKGARALGKAPGRYVTISINGLKERREDAFGRAARALARELADMMQLADGATVLVVGLGNRAITPDAVGPQAAEHTMATRHLVTELPDQFGSFRPVAALSAGVLGTTGMESGEMVKGVVAELKPACIVAVDALASRSLSRVCSTIQLADTGIVPGSGVGNHRVALTRQALGVPVIAVGAPTVVDGATLCADLLAEAGKGNIDPKTLKGISSGLFVTPRDIDSSVSDLAKVIGYGLNLALQPGLTIEDIDMFLS